MADVNVTDLTQETYSTMDGTEQVIMFDSAEGKRATVAAVGEYVLKKLTTSLNGSTQTVANALASLNSDPIRYRTVITWGNYYTAGTEIALDSRWTNYEVFNVISGPSNKYLSTVVPKSYFIASNNRVYIPAVKSDGTLGEILCHIDSDNNKVIIDSSDSTSGIRQIYGIYSGKVAP